MVLTLGEGHEQYRWKNRLLVINAPAEDDENLRQQLDEVTLTRGEFDDRDMVLITLLDVGVSTAGQQKLAAGEAAAARVALGITSDSFELKLIGKDGSVKLSSKSVVAMAEIYALIDTMPRRRREVSRRY